MLWIFQLFSLRFYKNIFFCFKYQPVVLLHSCCVLPVTFIVCCIEVFGCCGGWNGVLSFRFIILNGWMSCIEKRLYFTFNEYNVLISPYTYTYCDFAVPVCVCVSWCVCEPLSVVYRRLRLFYKFVKKHFWEKIKDFVN